LTIYLKKDYNETENEIESVSEFTSYTQESIHEYISEVHQTRTLPIIVHVTQPWFMSMFPRPIFALTWTTKDSVEEVEDEGSDAVEQDADCDTKLRTLADQLNIESLKIMLDNDAANSEWESALSSSSLQLDY